jgi:hypothetical protein
VDIHAQGNQGIQHHRSVTSGANHNDTHNGTPTRNRVQSSMRRGIRKGLNHTQRTPIQRR